MLSTLASFSGSGARVDFWEVHGFLETLEMFGLVGKVDKFDTLVLFHRRCTLILYYYIVNILMYDLDG